ncbi:MAG TPA: flagellar biosynthetic protein FliR [Armatimonadetes bacterium]|jgi:flagellar biosynthetic protein FliR|nr:flagellar biosynthetic protein FliR [Armatimonadota bacterium]
MAVIDYIAAHIVVWLLVLVRVSGLFVTAPIFGNYQVPAQVRILMALALAVVLAPLAVPQTAPFPSAVLPFAAAILREALLGLAIGFIPMLLFLAMQYAAQLIDLQVGLGMGGWVDPTFRSTISPLSYLQYLLAMVLFLVLDGHHLIIEGLANSFRMIPLGTFSYTSAITSGFTELFIRMGLIGMQVAAPVLSIMLIADMGLGILGRAAPQLNLLIQSLSVKAVVALLALAAALPLFAYLMAHLFAEAREELALFLRVSAPTLGVGYGR